MEPLVINGVVNDNTHRTLDVSEFRGFALCGSVAPLVFVNGRDTKSAQIFTLVHELCHLALFQTGVSNTSVDGVSDGEGTYDGDTGIALERFCNSVAADFLVPTRMLMTHWEVDDPDPRAKIQAVAQTCKVNFLVVARKARDVQLITGDEYVALCQRYRDEKPAEPKAGTGGGDYFRNKQYKLGSVFTDTVHAAVHSDYLSYRDAYDLTGMSAPAFRRYLEWIEGLPDVPVMPTTEGTLEQYLEVCTWADDQNYTTHALREFKAETRADAWLCAEALNSDLTLVTYEVPSNSPNKVKIPNVCRGLGIRYISGFDFMRAEGFRF